MRIGSNSISREYDNKNLIKIEYKSDIQDMQYGQRLTKGDTYFIGGNDKDRYYMTRYKDGALELWVRRRSRSGYTEESLVCLLPNEVDNINKIIEMAAKPVLPQIAIPPANITTANIADMAFPVPMPTPSPSDSQRISEIIEKRIETLRRLG